MTERMTIWEQLVARKAEWVGGTLVDYGDPQDRAAGQIDAASPPATTITDITLTKSARATHPYFAVEGEEFSCGGSTEVLGIPGTPSVARDRPGALVLRGILGHEWAILRPGPPAR